jgi:hypothetical protein
MHFPSTRLRDLSASRFSIVIIFAALLGTFCVNDDFGEIIRAENVFLHSSDLPVPGSSGIISVSSITDEGLQLTWTRATDRTTPQSELEYRAFRSDSNNISTPAAAETSGTPLDIWLKDTTSLDPAGLDNNKTHYFNVIVKAQDGRKAAYTTVMAVTLGTIYMYSPSGTLQGGLTAETDPVKARNDIDSKCAFIPVAGPTNYRAFISISLTDVIKDFPTLYSIQDDWPVRSTTSFRIAWNWADMLDDSINETLNGAGVSSAAWWSGSNSDGSFDTGANCDGWTNSSGSFNGRTGDPGTKDKEWIDNSNAACSTPQKILCIAW